MSSVYTPSSVALGNITIPSDGDARSAASVNVPMQAIADGVKYVDARIASLEGNWQLVDYVTLTGTSSALALDRNGGDSPVVAALASASVATLVGDKVELEFTSAIRLSQAADVTNYISARTTLQANQNGGGLASITGSAIVTSNYKVNGVYNIPFVNRGVFTVATAGTLATALHLNFYAYNGAGDYVEIIDEYVCTLKIWRLL